jgi:predicted nucleic acid-binding protein
MPATYLDSSAIVKLVVAERESAALRTYLRRRQPLVSSALARTEVKRAVLQEGPAALARSQTVLERINLVRLNDRLLDAAGELAPHDLRSLDAIHLATALDLASDLGRVVTYDQRMRTGAEALGLATAAPGAPPR